MKPKIEERHPKTLDFSSTDSETIPEDNTDYANHKDEINKVAEKYHGGGHKMASGVKLKTFDEAMLIVKDLDKVCKKYKKENNLSEED